LALDVNAFVIKEQVLSVTAGIVLARMQKVIGVNILILSHSIQTIYNIVDINLNAVDDLVGCVSQDPLSY
jgi:hypothetical protein